MPSFTLEGVRINRIEWKQLWSLAALYASIVIGWIAYHNYQPKLLVKFNFTDFTFQLLLIQGIILVVTPLIAGKLGDRMRFQRGHRIPIISTGISFAAMVFMSVAFTLFRAPVNIITWLLPILIVLWLVAMSIFTSPALSTLELFTPVDKLPKAMAVLTIVANLVYSLEPVIIDIIDFIGAPLTFMAGGIAVFLSGYALKKNSLGLFNSQKERPRAEFVLDTQRSSYGYIFVIGILIGLATTVMFNFIPARLEQNLGSIMNGLDGKWILVIVLLISAVFSLPASTLVGKQGLERSFSLSLTVTAVCLGAIFLTSSAVITIAMTIIFAAAFAWISVSALPLAINKANYYEKVFCVGIFFSGVALPDGLVNAIQAF